MYPSGQADKPQSRPYRSKRHRPCDVCRRRKHGCFVNKELPCSACRNLGIQCTFNDAPRTRRNVHHRSRPFSPPSTTSLRSTDPPTETDAVVEVVAEDGADSGQIMDPDDAPLSLSIDGAASFTLEDVSGPSDLLGPPPAHHDFWLPASSLLDPSLGLFPPLSDEVIGMTGNQPQHQHLPPEFTPNLSALAQLAQDPAWTQQRPRLDRGNRFQETPNRSVPEQRARPLSDSGSGTVAQYSVLAGEVDPYLLRHMRFKDEGTCNFGQFQFRCLADELDLDETQQSQRRIPVQFLVSNSPQPDANGEEKAVLSNLIHPELGVRLVGL